MIKLDRRSFSRLVLAAGGAGLAGCQAALDLVVDREPPQLYTLTPKSTFETDLPQADWQLLVEPPEAAAGLDSVRIALASSPVTLEYYADVQWTTRAPEMVQTLLIESFENTGKIVSIGRETAALRADYILKTELREFQAETQAAGPPQVRVHVNTKLVRMPQRVIVAGSNFIKVSPAADDKFTSVIQAFDDALGAVMKQTVGWTLRTAAVDWQSRTDRR
jgi:cholesterol transport system auxiliary component